ncbi:MAG TPA: TetR/AcrR family transcriptional regulator [Actinomycetes bacterium]|nr:TetR/AcrR family transcriptional regulator [Actinomycetes bacterium]
MSQRRTRGERKEQTRADVVAAARDVFLRRGFHGASLEEITEHAGYTKGAVYSNFAGKDELFLAVLDAHAADRTRAYTAAALHASSFEEGLHALAREMTSGAVADPRWVPVLIEFWTHASRDELLRRQVSDRHQRALDAIAGVLETLAAKHDVAYRIPARDLARGHGAYRNGMELERLLDPDAAPPELFEEMSVGFVLGLTTNPTPTVNEDGRSTR